MYVQVKNEDNESTALANEERENSGKQISGSKTDNKM